ncbi:MAG: sugar transferase [Candidatus Helarchaeota archaeon]
MAELYLNIHGDNLKEQIKIKSKTIEGKINRIGMLAYERLKMYGSNVNIIGFVNTFKNPVYSINDKNIKYLGDLSEFRVLCKNYNVNFAYLAIDRNDVSVIHQVINLCNSLKIEYEFVQEVYDIIYGHVVERIFKEFKRPYDFSLRRISDIFFSIIFLILTLPIWPVISILIKIDSRGPVFYSQERVGQNGRIFRIFKFRTMYTDSEKYSGPVLAKKDDPRITKVGRFLRKTRIDEIPQILNVLIGDMTLIGPRPERPYFVEKYSMDIPMYKNRLKIKPGLNDLYYLEKKNSLLFNLKILLKTIGVVLMGKGQ